MISKLKGLVDSVGENFLILDVSGVGYQAFCSRKTLEALGHEGEACTLYTEMIVREDLIHLYGFASGEERSWFRLLTSVQGVGNRVGLALLSVADPGDLALAISREDKAFVTQADGVGPKLASRVISELKEKVTPFLSGTSSDVVPFPTGEAKKEGSFQDAVSALVHLGYRQNDALQAVQFALQNQEGSGTVEDLIRVGLTKLAKV